MSNSSIVITGTVLTLNLSAQVEVVNFGGTTSTSTATNSLSVATTVTS
jgi:hypothetical protein